jgi:RNA polymerase sigma-70 factor (ECF subfamily)
LAAADDYQAMDCRFYREAISVRIDGETEVLESQALDAHLASCRSCRDWALAAQQVTRRVRVAAAEAVPDLAPSIMARLAASPAGADEGRGRLRPAASPTSLARFTLLLVALAQIGLAVPGLMGDDSGAPVHVAHEQGSWALALAIGLLVVAWRPSRAAGTLPLVATLVACLTFTTALDISAGRTIASAEAPHFLALLGVGLLWLIAHLESGDRTPSDRLLSLHRSASPA